MKKKFILGLCIILVLFSVGSVFAVSEITVYNEDGEVDAGTWNNQANTVVTRTTDYASSGVGSLNATPITTNNLGWSYFNYNITSMAEINFTFNIRPSGAGGQYVGIASSESCNAATASTAKGGLSFDSGSVNEFAGAGISTHSDDVWEAYELIYFWNGTQYQFNVSRNNTLLGSHQNAVDAGNFDEPGCVFFGGVASTYFVDNLFIKALEEDEIFVPPTPGDGAVNETRQTFALQCSDKYMTAYFDFEPDNSNSTYTEDRINGISSITVTADYNATAGFIGGAYEYNGADTYIRLLSDPFESKNKTIAFWARFDGTSYGTLPILSMGASNYYFGFKSLGQLRYNYLEADGTNTAAIPSTVYGNIGDWVHVAISMIVDDSTNYTNMSFYLNGTLTDTIANNEGQSDNWGSSNMYIGAFSTTSLVWTGVIDELMFLNTTLNEAEVMDMFQGYTSNLGYRSYLYFQDSTPPNNLVLDNSTTHNYTFTGNPDTYYYQGICYNINDNTNISTGVRTWTFAPNISFTEKIPSGFVNTTDTFFLNISKAPNDITSITGNFFLINNNTLTITNDSDTYYLSVPESFNTSLGNYTYKYNLNITTPATNYIYNITGGIDIIDWEITECSSGNISLNFSSYDEDIPSTALVSDFEAEIVYWPVDMSDNKVLNVSKSGDSSLEICINGNSTLYTNTYIQYTTTPGFTHRYYLYNYSITNNSIPHYLYNFDNITSKSDLKITVRKADTYLAFPNVLSKLQRRYLSEGVWRTVQMDQSGDSGLIFFNIKEENTDYRIIFTDTDNNVLKTTNSMKFICTTGVCDVTFLLNEFSSTSQSIDINYNYSYNNATKNLTLDWVIPTGETTTVRASVIKSLSGGTITYCEETSLGSQGTFVCDLTGTSGVVFLNIETSNSPFVLKGGHWIDIVTAKIGELVGVREGSWWSAIIILMVVGGSLVSLVTALTALLFGMIIIGMLGLFTPYTFTFIVIISLVVIYLGWRLKY